MTEVRTTRRWRGVVGIALFVGAVGVLAARPLLLLLGVVGSAFAAYPHLTGTPAVDLSLERSLGSRSPEQGDAVEVTVRVVNEGSTLADLRIVDGVPPMLAVQSGSPRHGAVLRPGDATEWSYTVGADYGRHQFDPATVVARDVAGAREVETTVAAETELAVTDSVPEVPLRQQTAGHAGRVVTDRGGSGIEFHQTREYQHGDPMSRIDWRRFARTNTLTTIEFREERTAAVVLCVDADASAYRARRDDEPNAVAYSVAGAEQLLTSLGDARTFVGLAALGREFAWVDPGSGREHRDRLRTTLATHPALRTVPPTDPDASWVDTDQRAALRRRLGPSNQLFLFSPLTDDGVVTTALELEAEGTRVTVVSPNVTSRETAGGRLATVERDGRMRRLRESGVPVVDWDPTDPLGTELLRQQERGVA
ncbi:DUF58 domain-containing protein [Halobium salinum]|uniref:DUF58 domain-containing protein n=1 Tax=Halobium salinum TaxID=1364940 RepID=A0ABD5PB44_9EURY|nr:DUF58 domain-containing protein [Halobium salinum]